MDNFLDEGEELRATQEKFRSHFQAGTSSQTSDPNNYDEGTQALVTRKRSRAGHGAGQDAGCAGRGSGRGTGRGAGQRELIGASRGAGRDAGWGAGRGTGQGTGWGS